MSTFELFHIFDSAVHKLRFINFHSCQSCCYGKQFVLVCNPVLPRSSSPLFSTCCVKMFHITHVAIWARSPAVPITSTKSEIWIPVYKNVQPNAVLTAVHAACLLFGSSFNVYLIFLISPFQTHELGPACKQYLNRTLFFTCMKFLLCLFYRLFPCQFSCHLLYP